MTTEYTADSQTIEVPLKVGSRVTLLTDVDIEDGGSSGKILFDRVVEQYVPQTGKLVFSGECDIGRAEFLDLLEDADGVEILKE